MKKLIFSMLTLLAVGTSFTACGSDDEDTQYTHTDAPSVELKGTYTGTFTRIQTNAAEPVPEDGEGTVVIAPGENGYVAQVTFDGPSLLISAEKPVNIAFANDGAVFSNHKDVSQIVGSVDANGNLTVSFNLTIKISARSTRPYAITFVGTKTSSEAPVAE